MLAEDGRRILGAQLVVDVLAVRLVLDEHERIGQLADVVIVGRHTGEEGVGADRGRRGLSQVPDHQRVVVSAGRLGQEPAQERLRWVGQLHQL